MFTYIEMVSNETNKVRRRIDVTGLSERSIEIIDDGVNISLNHDKFHTTVTDYEYKQLLNEDVEGN